jgi:hypothetical protein
MLLKMRDFQAWRWGAVRGAGTNGPQRPWVLENPLVPPTLLALQRARESRGPIEQRGADRRLQLQFSAGCPKPAFRSYTRSKCMDDASSTFVYDALAMIRASSP